MNMAVDRDRLIGEVFAGYAHPVAALTPPYAGGSPDGQEPYPHDPDEAGRLLRGGLARRPGAQARDDSDVAAVAEHAR